MEIKAELALNQIKPSLNDAEYTVGYAYEVKLNVTIPYEHTSYKITEAKIFYNSEVKSVNKFPSVIDITDETFKIYAQMKIEVDSNEPVEVTTAIIESVAVKQKWPDLVPKGTVYSDSYIRGSDIVLEWELEGDVTPPWEDPTSSHRVIVDNLYSFNDDPEERIYQTFGPHTKGTKTLKIPDDSPIGKNTLTYYVRFTDGHGYHEPGQKYYKIKVEFDVVEIPSEEPDECKGIYIHELPHRDSAYIWCGWWIMQEIERLTDQGKDWKTVTSADTQYYCHLKILSKMLVDFPEVDVQESRNGYIVHRSALDAGIIY
ncbi:putative hoc protein [Serratia phage SP1]|nr:putative hoc protein [Serratia phage SP1]